MGKAFRDLVLLVTLLLLAIVIDPHGMGQVWSTFITAAHGGCHG